MISKPHAHVTSKLTHLIATARATKYAEGVCDVPASYNVPATASTHEARRPRTSANQVYYAEKVRVADS